MAIIKKAKVIGTGTATDPFRVNLPTYAMQGPIAAGTVDILVPDDEVDIAGKLDKQRIRKKYQGQQWDNAQVGDDT